MPFPTDDSDLPTPSGALRDELGRAMSQHRSSVAGLRDAVCTYHDALIAEGRSHDDVVGMINALVASVALPDARRAARRRKLVDEMIAWCQGHREKPFPT